MFILFLVLLSLAITMLRGGKLTRLGQVSLRFPYLVLVSLGIQILIFSPWWRSLGGEPWTPYLYVFSLLVLALWFALNRRLPGMAVICLGFALNLAAITANGGRMPASRAALERAGMTAQINAQVPTHTNTVLATDASRLYYLTDVLALPEGVPLANVFSLGDVFIALGAAYFLHRTLTDESLDQP